MTESIIENAPTAAPTRAELRATERADQRPNRRRKAIIAGALAGVLGGVLGGTAGIGALMTHTVTLDDFIKTGDVGSVEVGAWTEDPGTWLNPYEDLMPGDIYTQTLTVENAGKSDAYVGLIGKRTS